jgi:aryl-alcohol dehydrogenase-like predicted oxidoreductase
MHKTILGRTGLEVTRVGFGALPIQRVAMAEAVRILRRAYDAGVDFFDTARGYSDSEEKIGRALADVRDKIVIATKSPSRDRAGVVADVETSLRYLRTDHVDVLQLHNPTTLPDAESADSAYAGLMEARRRGLSRFVGITCHRVDVALAAARSGLFDTVQFPLSAISDPADLGVIAACREHNVGLIGMKALCGGLLRNARAAFAFLWQYENVVPIWGVQRMAELEEFVALDAAPPALDAPTLAGIEEDRRQLAGDFCRACGYCLPCPADIPIPMAARMSLLLRRAPSQNFLTADWREKMRRIEKCTDCGSCRSRCPYELDTPALLKRMLVDFEDFVAVRVA